MTKATLTIEAAERLIGRKIIEVGLDYIKLDDGLTIYLDESEIDNLNM